MMVSPALVSLIPQAISSLPVTGGTFNKQHSQMFQVEAFDPDSHGAMLHEKDIDNWVAHFIESVLKVKKVDLDQLD